MVRQVRRAGGKGFGMPTQNEGFCSETQAVISIDKAFQQPAPKEAGPTGHEYVLALHFFPKMRSVFEDMAQIFCINAFQHG